MNHYFSVHALNFNVQCGINDCPAKFKLYHSFYKHVISKHRAEYDQKLELRVPTIHSAPPLPGILENSDSDSESVENVDTITSISSSHGIDTGTESDISTSGNDTDSDSSGNHGENDEMEVLYIEYNT